MIALLVLSPISLSPLKVTRSSKDPPERKIGQAVLVRLGLGLVLDVLHEEQGQDIVLVLRGIHAPAELICALPE